MQFNTTVYIVTRFTPRFLWRLNASLTTNATAVATESKNAVKLEDQIKSIAANTITNDKQHTIFNELKTKLCNDLKLQPMINTKIKETQSLHEILEIMKTSYMSENDIVEVLKTVTTWVNENNESNLSNTTNEISAQSQIRLTEVDETKSEDPKDDDIDKYYNLSTAAMIVEVYKLAQVGKRDIKLLNYFFQNIIEYHERLTIGATSNLLYSMSTLCYSDERLLKKICTNLFKNQRYIPYHALEKFNSQTRLNLVWSFAIFKIMKNIHAEYVLNEKFVSKINLLDESKKLSYKLKLLNINGYVQCVLTDYSGPLLNNEIISNDVPKRSKQKMTYIDALEVTLKNMLPSTSCFNMNINTNMGFLLDAEIRMDNKFNFVNVNSDNKNEDFIKIGIIIVDYYDTCLGNSDHQGIIKLYSHLLKCKNYKVLIIPYQHFGLEDKLII
ncbi:Protein TBRG4 [Melipona quadrifasciata]|uniref:Protein TBRG4 n=1 Tax=Melipona quadrifasciata TaxID=166423 RepID=A0A0N0U4W7_9HYME|nr:Protein TBRG4 [Melipona quadrifasciata]